MRNEIETKIELLKAKMEKCEVGSVQFNVYREILDSLTERLVGEKKDVAVKLHVDQDTTCESCQ